MIEQQQRTERSDSVLLYLAYTGSIIAVTVAITVLNRIQLGEYGWMFTRQLIAIAVVTVLFAAATFARTLSPIADRLSAVKTGFAAGLRRPTERFKLGRALLWFASGLIALSETRLNVNATPNSESKRLFSVSVDSKSLIRGFEAVAYVVTGLALLVIDHRLFIIAIALLEAAAITALRGPGLMRSPFAVGSVCIVSWALASGMTYTRLGDWLLNGAASNGLAVIAFLFSFALVLIELCNDRSKDEPRRWHYFTFFAAFAIFAAFALRTDNLVENWVPFHRSYFADVSDFVRSGHWLLWDVPTPYGFLSILTLAIMPGGNGWQATYELTALFLTGECLIVFLILRWGRAGITNALFAVLFPLATLLNDGISRYPWSGRLYPQGGLRFFWIACLLLCVFLMHVWRSEQTRVTLLRWCGHFFWFIAVLWSVENALWATILWVPYLLTDVLTIPSPIENWRMIGQRAISRLWPLAALPLAAVAALETIYHFFLGIGPDWFSFVEFLGAFAKGQVRPIFHVQYLGASWILLLFLGATGALALYALRARRMDLVRLLTAAWFAVWGTSTYFALEPLDMYVTLLFGVTAPAIAIVIYCSREFLANRAAFLIRICLAPVAIIAISLLLGEPSHLAAMTMPLTPHYHADVIQDFKPISGELESLMRRAAIRPGSAVLFQNGRYWTEPTQGLIMQFGRDDSGKIVEYKSWLPISPIGPEEMIEGMSRKRQQVYIDRFLARSTETGWYITYRRVADCSQISSRLTTVDRYESTNFSAAHCALK